MVLIYKSCILYSFLEKLLKRSDFMVSLWLSSTEKNKFNELDKNCVADVCVIGAGIFGLSCAYYLSKLGFKVIVLERDEIGSKATGNTTAKITSQHDLFYTYLKNSYSEKFARDYLVANEQAIENIKSIIDEENIKCDFEFQNSYVYTQNKDMLPAIKEEVRILQDLGFNNCEFVTKTGLPFDVLGACCFKNQAQFHPIKYLNGLCDSIVSNNGEIFTNTTVSECNDIGDSYACIAGNFSVTSRFVIVATHYPFINFSGFYFTKMYQSTSYLIVVDPKKTLFNGMYISADKPKFSFRHAKIDNKNLLLIGGGEHKTGIPTCYADSYGLLEAEAKKYFPDCEVLYKWNTRDCISLDKLPYIGMYSKFLPNVYVGTGFKKWGMTLSNVAANIVVDNICGKKNKFAYLFDSSRLKPIKNFDEMKNVLVQSANSLVLDKLKDAQMDFSDIQNDSGSIIEIDR